ncbi:MAG: 4-amino-4-deoxy-L-arabinose transferase [Cyanobacteriota bacterium]|nr:4-amino-4-deoxy-L-arabinose transferase [Cyanobacteriota bacterium]
MTSRPSVSSVRPPAQPLRGLGLALAGLWLLAVGLALVGLGNLPLRDWDESLVARVALEASVRPWPDLLFPVFWGDPYLNKPPGLHLLIAAAIRLWRAFSGACPESLPPEGLVRLVPALLSTTVVPLVGVVQARLRPERPAAALASAAMALTLLPLARHGRLVMLDGVQLASILLLWWAVLTPDQRRGPLLRQGVVMGLATSALLLLKAPLALPVLGGTLLLRALDRELGRGRWGWLLGGLALGLLPGLAWHGAHGLVRGSGALEMWLGQGFARVHHQLEGHGGGPWMPLTEVLEGGWPWLALWPVAMGLAWRERHTRAGRWCLGTTGLTALLVLPLRTQLPWYSLLLWPSVLLACGPVLAWLVERAPLPTPPWPGLTRRVPAFWALLGALLVGVAPLLARGGPGVQPLAPVAAAGGVGLLGGGLLLLADRRSRRRVGAALLLAGLWVALLALFSGPLWLWELNERWPVQPIGMEVRRLPRGTVQLWREAERPSLNWYAGQRLRPRDDGADAGATPPALPLLLLGLEREAPRPQGLRCWPFAVASPGRDSESATEAVPQLFRCTPETPSAAPTPGPSGGSPGRGRPRPDGPESEKLIKNAL